MYVHVSKHSVISEPKMATVRPLAKPVRRRRKCRVPDERDTLQFVNVDRFFSKEANFNILYGILQNTDAKATTTVDDAVCKAEPMATDDTVVVKPEPADKPTGPPMLHASSPGFPRISLRTLEHLCTKFAQRQSATYSFQGQTYSVEQEYQKFLTTHGKAHFDVFRRSPDQTYIEFKKFGKIVYTTLCQLLFFKAAIQTGFLHYAVRHLPEIENDMADRLKLQRTTRRRRRSSSSSSTVVAPSPTVTAMDTSPVAPVTPATEVQGRLHELSLNEPKRLRLN